MSGRTVRIVLLAIAGLLVAAALGAAASRITSNQVGLYGEPPSVGSELVVEPAGKRAKPARKPEGGDGAGRHHGAGTRPDEGTTSTEEPEPVETEDGDSDDD